MISHFYRELRRVRWMLVAAVGVIFIRAYGILPETSTTLLALYKPSLAAIGFIAAHIGYQQAFPYIDQGEILSKVVNGTESQARFALVFLGVCIMRGAIYAAFILGVTLGL